MAGLEDFVDDGDDEPSGDTETLHLMQIEYEEQYDEPVTHMRCRTEDGDSRWVEVIGHRPSFYIHQDAFSRRIINHQWVAGADDGYESIHGENLVRLETELPWHVGGKREKQGLREYFDTTWEADVFYTSRFLIDTGIKTHFEVDLGETWERQSYDGDYRVHVDDIEAVEDPEWRVTPRTVTVDIEVQSPNGFPEAADAEQPVTAITAHDNYDDEYVVWVLRNPSWPYSDQEIRNAAVRNKPDAIELEDDALYTDISEVKVFDNESQMLHDFNLYVEDKRPDLLSGWNSSATDNGDAFDYPYLMNRCKALNTMSFRKWSPMGQLWTTRRGREQNLTIDGKGVGFFDMMQSYKKTTWSEPKGGWGLDNISGKELPFDSGKLEIDDIDNAWRDEPSEFLKYNIRDVQAVVGIDKAAGVVDMFQNLRSLAGVQFQNCQNNIDLLDVMILRYAKEMGVALPTNTKPDRGWYYGAHVFEPKLGRHENVVYPDLWSMYPNMIRNCNMSPETIIGTRKDLERSQYTEDDCRWTYIDTRNTNIKEDSDPRYEKVYFIKPSIKTGFMTEVVDDLMEMKDAYDGTPLYDAVKRVVNSVYGVYGDSESYGKGYRLFDWRIAEGICLGGRKMIQDSSERFVDALNDIKRDRGLDGNDAYRVGGDTDSVMTAIPFMDVDTESDDTTTVACCKKGEMEVPAHYDDYAEVVALAEDAAGRVNEWYSEWTAETFNLTPVGFTPDDIESDEYDALDEVDHFCELEIESYGPRCFIPEGVTKKKAKKRYAEIIAWEEGEWFSPPEFSVTGIDIVRSDRAEATRDILEQVLQIILREDDRSKARTEVYEVINEVVAEINSGGRPNSYIARPRGMSKHPTKYGSPTNTPMPTYKGAKYANEHFEWERLTAGSKPELLYIEDVRGSWPSTYPSDWETKEAGADVDAVALENPNELPDEFVVDRAKMVEKVLEDPLTPILSPMRWDFEEALDSDTYHQMHTDQDQGSIADFM
jgi:DNA polymerase elongation subunit (family B)